jgi:hypothetical protein
MKAEVSGALETAMLLNGAFKSPNRSLRVTPFNWGQTQAVIPSFTEESLF